MKEFSWRNGLWRVLTVAYCAREACCNELLGCDYLEQGKIVSCSVANGMKCPRFSRCKIRRLYKFMKNLDDMIRSRTGYLRYVYNIHSEPCENCNPSKETSCIQQFFSAANGGTG